VPTWRDLLDDDPKHLLHDGFLAYLEEKKEIYLIRLFDKCGEIMLKKEEEKSAR